MKAALVLGALTVGGMNYFDGGRMKRWLDGFPTRIKVEVLNGTRTRGLARRATIYLRDRGFDVVGSGTESEPRSTTVVYDRSAHPEWARLVARAINAPVVSRPDSSRYLDVTVILGADWRPPPLPFHP